MRLANVRVEISTVIMDIITSKKSMRLQMGTIAIWSAIPAIAIVVLGLNMYETSAVISGVTAALH